jgi:putative PEP-CTERM system TPR-repeat lipoprotein
MINTVLRWARPAVLAALLPILVLQGCNRDLPERFIASGKSYLAKHDYPAAVIQFKNAVQKAPESAEARFLLGVALEEQDDPMSAEIEFRKAIAARYAPAVVYPALVGVLVKQGQFEKAISEAATQENVNPARAQLLALTGAAQLGLGKVREAYAAFSTALSLEPANETAKLGMARIAATRSDLLHANQLVDEVLGTNPTSRDALLLKGDLLMAGHSNKEAAQAYEKAIELRPRSGRVYLTLIPLLLREGDIKGAKARVEALKKFARQAPLTQYLDAMVAYEQGDRSRAQDAIQAALHGGDYVPALLLAAAIAHDSGNYVQAEEHLLKVIGGSPNQAYPRRLLVSTYLRSGQSDRARESLASLLQLAPNDTATLNLAGEVALANGDVGKAAEYYEKALALDPQNALTRTRLGQTHLAAGDIQRAIEDLEGASAADVNQYQADLALVTLHLNRNELDKAQTAVDALAKKQPNSPLTYNLAGLVKAARKDQSGARSSFDHALQLQSTFFPAARNLAMLDIRDGKPDTAKQRYEAILAKDSKNEQALLALVELAQQTRAPASDIEKAIDRAVAANPDSARARILKVNYLLHQRRDPKSALAAAQQAQAVLPQNLQVLATLGYAQLAAGENDQAIASFGKVNSLTPKAPLPLLAQGQAYASAKDWSNARKVLQKAIDLQPKLVEAWVGLVRVDIQLGHFEEARRTARAMQRQWPTLAVGYQAEVEVLTAQKDSGTAERVLRSAIEKTKEPTLVIRLYSFLNEQGRKEEAQAAVRNWVAQNPKDILVESAAGQLSIQREDYAEAVKWYRNVVKSQPNDPMTLNDLAWALGQLQDPGALEYGEKALSLAPNAPAILDTVGWLHVERGDVIRGLELLKKARNLAPDIPSIQLNLAKGLIKAGQQDAARQELQVLAKLPTRSPVRDEAEKLLSSL